MCRTIKQPLRNVTKLSYGADLDVVNPARKTVRAKAGFKESFAKDPFYFARIEKLGKSDYWKNLMESDTTFRGALPIELFSEMNSSTGFEVPFLVDPMQVVYVPTITKKDTMETVLLTMPATEVVKPIHHRMPVLLPRTAIADWVDGSQVPLSAVKDVHIRRTSWNNHNIHGTSLFHVH